MWLLVLEAGPGPRFHTAAMAPRKALDLVWQKWAEGEEEEEINRSQMGNISWNNLRYNAKMDLILDDTVVSGEGNPSS